MKDGRLEEFTGGYSEWAAQIEGAGLIDAQPDAKKPAAEAEAQPATRKKAGKTAKPKPAAPSAPPQSKAERMAERQRTKDIARRLSRAKKQLTALEASIAEGEQQLEEIGHRMGDPAVYKDGDAVRALEAERGERKDAVDALYRDWERVAAEIESLEQAPS